MRAGTRRQGGGGHSEQRRAKRECSPYRDCVHASKHDGVLNAEQPGEGSADVLKCGWVGGEGNGYQQGPETRQRRTAHRHGEENDLRASSAFRAGGNRLGSLFLRVFSTLRPLRQLCCCSFASAASAATNDLFASTFASAAAALDLCRPHSVSCCCSPRPAGSSALACAVLEGPPNLPRRWTRQRSRLRGRHERHDVSSRAVRQPFRPERPFPHELAVLPRCWTGPKMVPQRVHRFRFLDAPAAHDHPAGR